jgi:hypothetical protein
MTASRTHEYTAQCVRPDGRKVWMTAHGTDHASALAALTASYPHLAPTGLVQSASCG